MKEDRRQKTGVRSQELWVGNQESEISKKDVNQNHPSDSCLLSPVFLHPSSLILHPFLYAVS
jgi:hypothetical protein